jgi:hypothetical protein
VKHPAETGLRDMPMKAQKRAMELKVFILAYETVVFG